MCEGEECQKEMVTNPGLRESSKKKLLRRKRTLEARKEMGSKSMEPAIPNPGEAETKTSHAD
jgi:hypothetical protein